jgi:SAM-dependent methyltransferase
MRHMVGSESKRTLYQRLRSGLQRRAHALWKRWFQRGPDFPAETALDWLVAALGNSAGDLRVICKETLLNYGCADVVASWAESGCSAEPVSETASPTLGFSKSLTHASSAELAREAEWRYLQGEIRSGDAAFQLLETRQTLAGDFLSPSRFVPNESASDHVLAVKHYLDAAQMRVSAVFESGGQELPHIIAPDDGRTVAVCEWMASLPPTATVADVGCGSGRFLVHLAERFPDAKLTGIDPCSALLDRLPPRVRRHRGTLLRTDVAKGTFDAAFAVESLEHCLVAKRGIAELCRIVRPGGRVLVIDKHRSKQALSQCEPWERWFFPHELTEWLKPFCDEIRIEPVSHGTGPGRESLFLAASGRRQLARKTGS